MNKAFIFDMDGVIVNSEQTWVTYEKDFFKNLFGKEKALEIGDTIGMSVPSVHKRLQSLGIKISLDKLQQHYDTAAFAVYAKATITPDIDTLVAFLLLHKFKLGLVTSSPNSWINKVLPRLSFKDAISSIISLGDQQNFRPKPNPDGYLAMMNMLKTRPNSTTILEDSNNGITSAKASGAYTIAFTANLVKGYKQREADVKARTMVEVISLVRNHYHMKD